MDHSPTQTIARAVSAFLSEDRLLDTKPMGPYTRIQRSPLKVKPPVTLMTVEGAHMRHFIIARRVGNRITLTTPPRGTPYTVATNRVKAILAQIGSDWLVRHEAWKDAYRFTNASTKQVVLLPAGLDFDPFTLEPIG